MWIFQLCRQVAQFFVNSALICFLTVSSMETLVFPCFFYPGVYKQKSPRCLPPEAFHIAPCQGSAFELFQKAFKLTPVTFLIRQQTDNQILRDIILTIRKLNQLVVVLNRILFRSNHTTNNADDVG